MPSLCLDMLLFNSMGPLITTGPPACVDSYGQTRVNTSPVSLVSFEQQAKDTATAVQRCQQELARAKRSVPSPVVAGSPQSPVEFELWRNGGKDMPISHDYSHDSSDRDGGCSPLSSPAPPPSRVSPTPDPASAPDLAPSPAHDAEHCDAGVLTQTTAPDAEVLLPACSARGVYVFRSTEPLEVRLSLGTSGVLQGSAVPLSRTMLPYDEQWIGINEAAGADDGSTRVWIWAAPCVKSGLSIGAASSLDADSVYVVRFRLLTNDGPSASTVGMLMHARDYGGRPHTLPLGRLFYPLTYCGLLRGSRRA